MYFAANIFKVFLLQYINYKTMNLNNVTVKLRNKSVVNSVFLNDRIRRFIRNTSFDSRYISLIIKISANNDSFWRSIDRRVLLDLNNKEDITNYINRLIRYTNTHIEDWYNGLNPEYIHFQWINANHKNYVIYQNNIKISNLYKKLSINIDKPHNIPFDIHYSTWGNSISKIKNEIIINNITINDNIDSIIVKDLDYLRTSVILNFKFGGNVSFIDLKKDTNFYLRSFSKNIKYYFNNIIK